MEIAAHVVEGAVPSELSRMMRTARELEGAGEFVRGLAVRERALGMASGDDLVCVAEEYVRRCSCTGLALMQSGQHEAAFAHLQRAERATTADGPLAGNEPTRLRLRAVAFNNLGLFYHRTGKLEAAVRHLAAARDVEATMERPENPGATLVNLAQVLAALRRWADCEAAATAAVRLLEEARVTAIVSVADEADALCAVMLALLSEVAERRGDFGAAAAASERVAALLRRLHGEGNIKAYDAAARQRRMEDKAKVALAAGAMRGGGSFAATYSKDRAAAAHAARPASAAVSGRGSSPTRAAASDALRANIAQAVVTTVAPGEAAANRPQSARTVGPPRVALPPGAQKQKRQGGLSLRMRQDNAAGLDGIYDGLSARHRSAFDALAAAFSQATPPSTAGYGPSAVRPAPRPAKVASPPSVPPPPPTTSSTPRPAAQTTSTAVAGEAAPHVEPAIPQLAATVAPRRPQTADSRLGLARPSPLVAVAEGGGGPSAALAATAVPLPAVLRTLKPSSPPRPTARAEPASPAPDKRVPSPKSTRSTGGTQGGPTSPAPQRAVRAAHPPPTARHTAAPAPAKRRHPPTTGARAASPIGRTAGVRSPLSPSLHVSTSRLAASLRDSTTPTGVSPPLSPSNAQNDNARMIAALQAAMHKAPANTDEAADAIFFAMYGDPANVKRAATTLQAAWRGRVERATFRSLLGSHRRTQEAHAAAMAQATAAAKAALAEREAALDAQRQELALSLIAQREQAESADDRRREVILRVLSLGSRLDGLLQAIHTTAPTTLVAPAQRVPSPAAAVATATSAAVDDAAYLSTVRQRKRIEKNRHCITVQRWLRCATSVSVVRIAAETKRCALLSEWATRRLRTRAAKIIQRFFQRTIARRRAAEIAERRHEAKLVRWSKCAVALQVWARARTSETLVAAKDAARFLRRIQRLQALQRGVNGRRRACALAEKRARELHIRTFNAACTIQGVWRRSEHRRHAAIKWEAIVDEHMSHRQVYAATHIQAAWRMHHDGRPVRAVWQRRRDDRINREARERVAAAAAAQLQRATRVLQRAFRAHLARRQLKYRRTARLKEKIFYLDAAMAAHAARLLQRFCHIVRARVAVARRRAAVAEIRKLRAWQRDYEDREARELSDFRVRNAYVTKIQAAGRAFCERRKWRRHRILRVAEWEAYVAASEAAGATVIQRVWRTHRAPAAAAKAETEARRRQDNVQAVAKSKKDERPAASINNGDAKEAKVATDARDAYSAEAAAADRAIHEARAAAAAQREAQAATQIQRAVRQQNQRSEAHQQNRSRARARSSVPGAPSPAAAQEAAHAATQIQRAVRQQHIRHEARQQTPPRVRAGSSVVATQEEVYAATQIQRVVRGRQARQRVDDATADRQSAVELRARADFEEAARHIILRALRCNVAKRETARRRARMAQEESRNEDLERAAESAAEA